MKNQTLGFIGGGRITRIFLQAFKNKNVTFTTIRVFDINPEITLNLQLSFSEIEIAADVEEIAGQDIIFVALHPPVILETLEKLKPLVRDNTVVISLAPKISIEKIRSVLEVTNIVRLIPNATSYINEGYNPISFCNEFDSAIKDKIMPMLEILGDTFEVDESKLEGYALISAMLPTYFWFQWKELLVIGEQTGLTREESTGAVFESLQAALNLMFRSGLNYEDVTDLIPVKPIGENEAEIKKIFQEKLMGLFQKIKP